MVANLATRLADATLLASKCMANNYPCPSYCAKAANSTVGLHWRRVQGSILQIPYSVAKSYLIIPSHLTTNGIQRTLIRKAPIERTNSTIFQGYINCHISAYLPSWPPSRNTGKVPTPALASCYPPSLSNRYVHTCSLGTSVPSSGDEQCNEIIAAVGGLSSHHCRPFLSAILNIYLPLSVFSGS